MELGAIDAKKGEMRQTRYSVDSKNKDPSPSGSQMTEAQELAPMKMFEAKLISPEGVSLWQCGASTGG